MLFKYFFTPLLMLCVTGFFLFFSIFLFSASFIFARIYESNIFFLIGTIIYSAIFYSVNIDVLFSEIKDDFESIDDYFISSVEKENFWHFFIIINLFVSLNLCISFILVYVFSSGITNDIYPQLAFIPVALISFYALFKYWNYFLTEKEELTQQALSQLPTPLQKALNQCTQQIGQLLPKVQKAQTKLAEIPNSTFLSKNEKSNFTQQIIASKALYQKQLNNYASSFLKLHLAEEKEKLGKIVNAVFNQGKEVEGEQLKIITNDVNNLLEHEYWQYTDMDKSEFQALLPILTKLKKIDQRETFAEQVSDLAPTKDLLNLDDHELQTQIELANLKNTQNLTQQTLAEFTQSTQQLNDELARLEAENDVVSKFSKPHFNNNFIH